MTRLVYHAMAALMPGTERLPGFAERGGYAFVRQLLRETSWSMWLGVVAGSLIFAVSPVLTLGVPLPSSLLSPERLDAHADRIVRSRYYYLRNLVFLVKMMAALGWGADAEVRGELGLAPYPPDPGTWRRR